MSTVKIRWEKCGSMHVGYMNGDEYPNFSHMIQGPTKGMYALSTYTPAYTPCIEEFTNLETAQLAAEKMEESKC